MKIAQVAPLYESVPPRLYGGTERVVSYLTEQLVREGHDVTLYASGDSRTSARLRPVCPQALRLRQNPHMDPLAWHMLLIETAVREAEQFDVLHFHIDYLPFSVLRHTGIPALSTIHSRMDVSCLHPLFREFRDMSLISISDAQRAPMPWASWLQTIHHGLPENLLQPCYAPQDYLAFLGRISQEKRVDRAIEIAGRAGMQLRVAAKVNGDERDREYFLGVRDLLELPHVDFLGEIREQQKGEFLGNAQALLFPIDWPEPFGLVMIEALACGTPVIAFRRGSVEEIIDDGVTGFIVDSMEEAVEAARHVGSLNRRDCRRAFEQRFSARRMCSNYLRAYERVIDMAARPDLETGDLPLAS
jgi:glycosyltransferase involved in cell wall biosynthesis